MSALGVLIFIVFVAFAIAFHELGHFATAKWFGIKVERYMIGFGPPLWTTKRGETEYGIAMIPAGGYVRIAGMNPLEEIRPEDRARTFKAKPGWQQAIVLAAGSFTHFLVAVVMLAGLFWIVPSKPTTTIASVSPTLTDAKQESPAKLAGFRAGDTILAIDGTPIGSWDQSRTIIRASAGKTLRFRVARDGTQLTLTAAIATQGTGKDATGILGVASKLRRAGAGSAVAEAGSYFGSAVVDSVKGLGTLVSPHTISRLGSILLGTTKRGSSDVTSLVGVGEAAGGLAGRGQFGDLFLLIAGLNIFLGVVNLVPLPPLDGGHLAVLGYETVVRRRVDMRKLMPVTVAVVSIIIVISVLAISADIIHPVPSLPG